MYIQLYEKLVIIQKAYENIQALGENIYENLKHKNVNAVQKLQIEQLQYIDGLKGLSSSFEEMVVQFCKEQGVESFRVSALFLYFSREEIEKIEKIQKNLNVLLKTTESIVDSVSEYNLERNNNSQIFMNELL